MLGSNRRTGMKEWYKHTDDITLKDGSKVKQYRLVFETTDSDLAEEVEKYFQMLMDGTRNDIAFGYMLKTLERENADS